MGINNAVGGYQYLSRDVYRDIREELKKKKKKRLFKNFIALDVYSSANHFHFIVGNYCKHDKSDRLKKKKKRKASNIIILFKITK